MSEYIFKKLEAVDAPALRFIRLEALKHYPNNYTATYECEVAHDEKWFADLVKREWVFGAFNGRGDLCATACLTPDLRPRNQHKALLRMVYVAPAFQRSEERRVGKEC